MPDAIYTPLTPAKDSHLYVVLETSNLTIR